MASLARPWVKICGLTTPQDVDDAVAAGADAVGLVFAPGSPRHLALERGLELAQHAAGRVQVVVVGRTADPALMRIAATVGADWVQGVTPRPTGPAVLPVWHLGDNPEPRGEGPVLIDGPRPGQGVPADWSRAAAVAVRRPVVLAGGLNPDNVAAAIAAVRPVGVDVSSGVERARGRKDAALVEAFVVHARRALAKL